MSDVPKSHPRYLSLVTRDRIVEGVEKGITSIHGLIAQGRGEAFDYLIGEKTQDFAFSAIDAACALMLTAKYPVVSVNGNVAALVGAEIVKVSELTKAKIEVNIFHTSKEREEAISKSLKDNGAKDVLMPSRKCQIDFIDHNRKYINPEGIFQADVVFVPLEDGDRCEALIKNGKKVITIDLNPKSRTSRTATISIVDNIIRAIQVMIKRILELSKLSENELEEIVGGFDNEKNLEKAAKFIAENF